MSVTHLRNNGNNVLSIRSIFFDVDIICKVEINSRLSSCGRLEPCSEVSITAVESSVEIASICIPSHKSIRGVALPIVRTHDSLDLPFAEGVRP
jgi:hypothetical protein